MSTRRRPPTVVPEPEPLGPSELLPGLAVDDPYRPTGQRFWRRLRRHRLAVGSAVVLVLLAAACFAAPLLAPYGPNQQHLALGAVGPSLHHWFGTDELGRDELARLLYAGQISLEIGLAVALLSTLVGTIVGAVAGYVGKTTDQALMRVTDLFLVLPALAVLALALEKFGHDRLTIIWVLAALFWMYIARVVRAQVLALKEQEYIEAARASGTSVPWIVWRHVLPNCVSQIVVNATLRGRRGDRRRVRAVLPRVRRPAAGDVLGTHAGGRRGLRRHVTGVPPLLPGARHPRDHPRGQLPRRRTPRRLRPPIHMTPPLLHVEHLAVEFPTDDGPLHAVDDLGFDVADHEVVGLVGESGSGKTVTTLAPLGCCRPARGARLGAGSEARSCSAGPNGSSRAPPRRRDLDRLPGAPWPRSTP